MLLEEVLTKIPNPSHTHLLIAFEHLSLYIQKHLGQSVVVCGSLWSSYNNGQQWTTIRSATCVFIFSGVRIQWIDLVGEERKTGKGTS